MMMKRMLSLVLALCLLIAFARAEETAMTINGVMVSRQEAVYYILSARQKYRDIAAHYQNDLGIDYFSMAYSSGLTVEQMIKSDVFQEMVMMNVFYNMALGLELSLTEEQITACDADARAFCDALSVRQAQTYALDPEHISLVLKKQLLADSVYSLLLNQTDVDAEAIALTVDPADYIEYEVEYLFRQKPDYDSAVSVAGSEPPEAEEIIAALARAKEVAADGSLASGLMGEDEYGIVYGIITVQATDESVDAELRNRIVALTIGQCTDVIETELGYFLLRLIDNTAVTAYEKAVSERVYQARVEAFSAAYQDLFNEAEYEIDVLFWDSLTISGE